MREERRAEPRRGIPLRAVAPNAVTALALCSGLTGIRQVGDGTDPGLSSPAAFSFLAPSYSHKYGVEKD